MEPQVHQVILAFQDIVVIVALAFQGIQDLAVIQDQEFQDIQVIVDIQELVQMLKHFHGSFQDKGQSC